MLEANFWRGDNKRLAEGSERLTPKKMEEIGGICALGNLKVDVLGGQRLVRVRVCAVVCVRINVLEKSLEMASRVLWAGAIKSMR